MLGALFRFIGCVLFGYYLCLLLVVLLIVLLVLLWFIGLVFFCVWLGPYISISLSANHRFLAFTSLERGLERVLVLFPLCVLSFSCVLSLFVFGSLLNFFLYCCYTYTWYVLWFLIHAVGDFLLLILISLFNAVTSTEIFSLLLLDALKTYLRAISSLLGFLSIRFVLVDVYQ